MSLAMPKMRGVPPRMKNISLQTRHTMLDRMTLHNFKGHKKLDLELGRITALIGPTGSGKSTVLQALLILKATLEKGGGATGGDAYDYGKFSDIVTGGDAGRRIRIGVKGKKITSKDGGSNIASAFTYSAKFGADGRAGRVDATVNMRRGSDTSGPYEITLEHAYGSKRDSDTITIAGTQAGHGRQAGTQAGHGRQAGTDGGFAPRMDPHRRGSVRYENRKHVDGGFAPRMDLRPGDYPVAGAFAGAFENGEYFRTLLDGVWHVPFSRVVTSYALPLRYDTDLLSADRAKGASSLLSHLSTDPPLLDKVSSLLAGIGLRQIVTRNIPTARSKPGMLTADLVGGKQPSAVVHEGSGSNQLVMLLAVLAGSPRGSVITIEEPEIHLDPETQSKLVGAMLKISVEEDKQIIFTSHSSHLLYPLLGHVKKKEFPITNSDVAINYFDTDKSGAVAGADRLAVNERGQVDGGLRGFWNANMKALDDLLG